MGVGLQPTPLTKTQDAPRAKGGAKLENLRIPPRARKTGGRRNVQRWIRTRTKRRHG